MLSQKPLEKCFLKEDPGSQLRGQEDWGRQVTQGVDPKKVIGGFGHKLFRWGDGHKATLE